MKKQNTITDADRVMAELIWARANNKGGWAADLYRTTGCIVHSRISSLRDRGHVIECKRFGRRDFRYRLVPMVAVGGPVE